MSRSRLPLRRRFAAKMESLRQKIRGKLAERKNRKPRRLMVDALEQRMLMSVTPIDYQDTLVNQVISNSQGTGRTDVRGSISQETGSQSIAASNNGDFVITWTRKDPILDSSGNPVLDSTGQATYESNIYARYFTDEVQRISLPAEVQNDATGQYARFSLAYGAGGVQKLTVSAVNAPVTAPMTNGTLNVAGTINLGFDVNGDNTIAGVNEVKAWTYSETANLETLRASLQSLVRSFGGTLDQAAVTAVNPHEFLISVSDTATAGLDTQLIVDSASFTSGLLPSAAISTVQKQTLIANIPVVPGDPYATARAIQNYFNVRQTLPIGPIDFPPPDRVNDAAPIPPPYREPQAIATSLPMVTVTPVLDGSARDGLVFDITFGGEADDLTLRSSSGKKNHPPLVITAVTDENGAPLATGSVVTLKEPSDEFRVNPAEVDDILTPGPDYKNQTNPSIAMDADGDFVIAWQSEVAGASVSDIFARRFSPMGVVADPSTVRGFVTQGVRSWYDDVQLLGFKANAAGRLSGSFKLKVGTAGIETSSIAFDSDQLVATASAIEAALGAAGFDGVTVRTLNSSSPFRFEVRFGGLSGGYDQPQIVFVPETGSTLNATVTVTDSEEATASAVDAGTEDISTFQVNTTTERPQYEPTVAMDQAGNFTIAWAEGGQINSFNNAIKMQRFGRRGERRGGEYELTIDRTITYMLPFVSMSPPVSQTSDDGRILVSWTATTDQNYYVSKLAWTAYSEASLFDANGSPLRERFTTVTGHTSSAFDSGGNFAIAASAYGTDPETTPTILAERSGVRAQRYQPDGQPLRDEFRVNSASFNVASAVLWPNSQEFPRVGLDADGDMVVTYQGFGPDVSENINFLSAQSLNWLRQLIRNRTPAEIAANVRPEQTNEDLLQYFDPSSESLPIVYIGQNGDVDSVLEAIMIRAYNQVGGTPTAAQQTQFGRLWTVLNQVAGLLRGEANGALFSRFDADPINGQFTTLYSDSVANSQRDGSNTRYLIYVGRGATAGGFTLRVTNPNTGGFDDVAVAAVFQPNNGPLDVGATQDAIFNALRGAARVGINWPYDHYEGPIQVRTIGNFEIGERDGTPWDITGLLFDPSQTVIYEVTFQGEVHDTPMTMGVSGNTLTIAQNVPASVSTSRYFAGDEGRTQTDVAMDMMPDGSFVVAWTQQEESTSGATANQNIYYRRFAAVDRFGNVIDDAGPRIVELMDADGRWIDNQGAVKRPAKTVIVSFDEDMLTTGPDSVTSLNNWELLKNGVKLPGGIKAIHYGMNLAADLYEQDPVKWASLNPVRTNKYEAVFELDGNGSEADPVSGTPDLAVGVYTLRGLSPVTTATPGNPVRSGLRDKAGNPLGSTGFNKAGANMDRVFVVNQTSGGSGGGSDLPVVPPGTPGSGGHTHAETPNAVAVDADGDYVVVWTAADSAGRDRVYMQLFDAAGARAQVPVVLADGTPVGGTAAIPVLEVTPQVAGSEFNNDEQRYGSVAVDADGDIVVTWTNFRDADGNAATGTNGREQQDVYVRRFNAMGGLKGVTPLGERVYDAAGSTAAIRANSFTSGNQGYSAVAADVDGDFVVTWVSTGQEGGANGNGIYAQRFDSYGVKQGNEIHVNATVQGNQQGASVAMDAQGRFVVTWSSDPTGTDSDILARMFAADGTPAPGEIAVNTTTTSNQRYADVSMDLSGDHFVVAWQSAGQDLDGDGIYARVFTAGVGAGEIRVNTTTTGNQFYPSVAMNHQGNFAVTWSGRGEQTGQRDTSGVGGVYVQRYNLVGGTGQVDGGETRINAATTGNQWLSSVGIDGEGNYVVAWTGVGTAPNVTDVYYLASVTVLPVNDQDGPIVTDVTLTNGQRLRQGEVVQPVAPGLSAMKVLFGENLSPNTNPSDPNSVLNPVNWSLWLNGVELTGAIVGVDFVRNPNSRKYEATVHFDGNGLGSGIPVLPTGNYVLVVSDAVNDGVNSIDGDYNGVPGTNAATTGYSGYAFQFSIAGTTPGDTVVSTPTTTNARTFAEAPGAVAVDADGDYVVTWTAYDTIAKRDRVYFRLYDADGTPADLPKLDASGNVQTVGGVVQMVADAASIQEVTPQIAGSAFIGHDQRYATVAIDADGDFIITWTDFRNANNNSADGNEEADIFARRFNSLGGIKGVKTNSSGAVTEVVYETGPSDPFQVNTTTANAQKWSSVAVDVNGDFVIAWSSWGQENVDQLGSGYGVYAQRYNSFGQSTGPEFLVNTTIAGDQILPSVAMDAQGRFAITWTGQANGGDEVYLRMFNADGSSLFGPTWGEILVNATTAGDQRYSDVAMDLSGNNVVVTWSSSGQDGDGWGVYARSFRYQPGTTLTAPSLAASSAETPVNTSTARDQMYSSVATNHQGDFTVVWSGRGNQVGNQDTAGTGGVFAQRYDLRIDGFVAVGSETRLNGVTAGNQTMPSVSSDGAGNFVAVWTGPQATTITAVYAYQSSAMQIVADNDGPIVTDVNDASGARLLDYDRLAPLKALKVVFGENLSLVDGLTGDDSVLNTLNWGLTVNGRDVSSYVASVTFQRNPLTHKYEATVNFDSNAISAGAQLLGTGDYVLSAKPAITDSMNSVDGNYDGTADALTAKGYEFHFSIGAATGSGSGIGNEFLVNATDVNGQPNQTNAVAVATGNGQEQSNTNIAVDHDGDFVAVWMVTNGQSTTIMARVYNRNNVALTGEIAVATATGTLQRDPSVAIDADGDFVVAWSQEDPASGTTPKNWNVYVQRFTSMGVAVGTAVRVNATNTTSTQFDQVNPSVAMDDFGNFVVVWAEAGTNFGWYNDIRGQRFNVKGEKVGSELLVNSTYNAATNTYTNRRVAGLNTEAGKSVNNPTVAMHPNNGDFVVAWDEVTLQRALRPIEQVVMVRAYNANGTVKSAVPLQGNVGTSLGGDDYRRAARNPKLAVHTDGTIHLVYEGHGPDASGQSYNIYWVPLNGATGAPNGVSTQINDPQFGGDQVNPSIALDRDGNMLVAFNGAGGQPDLLNGQVNLRDADGVFFRRYDVVYAVGAAPQITLSKVEQRVNQTEGGIQQFASVGMTADGDPVFVWSGRGAGDRQGIFARRFTDSFDTVGPIVTDLVAPNGVSIPQRSQVNAKLQYLVMTFDEQMFDVGPNDPDWANSVRNPANYTLVRVVNGVSTELVGAIKSVTFGLNKGYDTSDSILPGYPTTNKWEAVLELDGNGSLAGSAWLTEGHYILSATNNLLDVKGNPLNKTTSPALPDGANTDWIFDVGPTSDQETVVNTPGGATNQLTQSPQSTASDADGDTVVVWRNEDAARPGVYAKLYRQVWTDSPTNGRTATNSVVAVINPATGRAWTYNEIAVTLDPTASYASVARDADGDFVVTWSQQDANASGAKTDWNVYARRYNAAGQALGPAFRVNSLQTTSALRYSAQRYSTVAMDVEGDFVVTYQSDKQDGSGYGIYAQRYSPAGNPLGGVDEVQLLTFAPRSTGTFRLGLDLDGNGSLTAATEVTGTITYTGSAYGAVGAAIESAFAALGVDVDVQAITQDQLLVQFIGRSGSKNLPLITLYSKAATGGTAFNLTASLQSDGKAGEFLVNETTANNQTLPTIAMDADGDFVITWTSQGQGLVAGADTATQTNIYARKFISNRWLRGANVYGAMPQSASTVSGQDAKLQVVSTDTPSSHVIPPGSGFDGVVQINTISAAGTGLGTGSLLYTGHHILTAAHVVQPMGTATPLAPNQVTVTFQIPNATGTGYTTRTVGVSQISISPNYTATAPGQGGDIAVLTLADDAPSTAERYNLYRQSNELGKVWSVYGYGGYGQGSETTAANSQKRVGQNVFEATGSSIPGYAPDLLFFDYDNGQAANDFFGNNFGLVNLGLGTAEANTALGDSGGPMFINGQIAAIVTGGGRTVPGLPNFVQTDNDAALNFSFGEYGFDTRVSVYADWIDDVIQANTPQFLVNTTTTGNQAWSDIAMDLSGDFVITWTSAGQDALGSPANGGNGVYAQRYNAAAVAQGTQFQVNTYVDGDQQHSSIGMDADGDFTIAWESAQEPSSSGRANFGIYAQRYTSAGATVGGEFGVNTTTNGDQKTPSVALDHAGDAVVVWSGNGERIGNVDSMGVFLQRYQAVGDAAGAIVTDVLNVVNVASGRVAYAPVRESSVLTGTVSKFVLDMGEDLNRLGGVGGVNSILNPANWLLTRNGVVVPGGIAAIAYAFNSQTLKYEVTITFDGSSTQSGQQPLGPGDYVLTIREQVWDLFDNWFDGNQDGTPRGDFQRRFTIVASGDGGGDDGGTDPGDPDTNQDEVVNHDQAGIQSDPAVATDADGNYVVVWVAPAAGGTTDIVGQRMTRAGRRVGPLFTVASYTLGNQIDPDVAMDRYGNFVVTWAGVGLVGSGTTAVTDTAGVWARVFNASGVPQGNQFQVAQARDGTQDRPAIAMGPQGNFAVTWSSNAVGGQYDVYARRFNANGTAASGEFRVNAASTKAEWNSDVAMDDAGNFVVTWEGDGASTAFDVYAQRYSAAGAAQGSRITVNKFTAGDQKEAQVAMDSAGNFIVAWQSYNQDGNGLGVYGKLFSAAGAVRREEFLVNEWTTSHQYQAAVSMSDNGKFVISWSSQHQDDPRLYDYGVYGRIYNADGSNWVNSATGLAENEFRLNGQVVGNQSSPAVAMDADGDFVAVWVGPDTYNQNGFTENAVFHRRVRLNRSASTTTAQQAATLAAQSRLSVGWSGGWTADPSLGGPTSSIINGTSGNDTFIITLAATPDLWQISVNGQTQTVDPRTVVLTFDGLGGADNLRITGAAGIAEDVQFSPENLSVIGNGYTLTGANFEYVRYIGNGGDDTVTANDSAGADRLVATARGGASGTDRSATLSGTGYAFVAESFKSIVANARGNVGDEAQLSDSAGVDTFSSSLNVATMVGSGYSVTANRFVTVQANSTAGADVARIYDSSVDDAFVLGPAQAQRTTLASGTTYTTTAIRFKQVFAYAKYGGTDTAVLNDSTAYDVFTAYPTYAIMTDNQSYTNRVEGFEKVTGVSRTGDSDWARLYDGDGQDTLTGDSTFVQLTGPTTGGTFTNRAEKFRNAYVYSHAGQNDQADISGSTSVDTATLKPGLATLTNNSTYTIRVELFDTVRARSNEAQDVAYLYGQAGVKDTLVADAALARLISGAYENYAYGFGKVIATGTAGDGDTATLNDSIAADAFYANKDYGQLSGSPNGKAYSVKAMYFDTIEAVSTKGGNDTAKLQDRALNDLIEGDLTWAKMTYMDLGFVRKTTGFKTIATSQNSDDDIRDNSTFLTIQ